MSGYGTCRWTCGECGESYEASGVVGDSRVDRWARDHREQHRVQKMSPEDRDAYYQHKIEVHMEIARRRNPELPSDEQGDTAHA